MTRKNQVKVRTSVWIETDQGKSVFGKGRLQILTAIQDTGSIKAAAEAMGMSYRGLWGRLKTTEKRLGFALVVSQPGSGPQSGSRLTPEALALMAQYETLLTSVEAQADEAFQGKLAALLQDD